MKNLDAALPHSVFSVIVTAVGELQCLDINSARGYIIHQNAPTLTIHNFIYKILNIINSFLFINKYLKKLFI